MRKQFRQKLFTRTRIPKTTPFTRSKTLLCQEKRRWLSNLRLTIQSLLRHQTRIRKFPLWLGNLMHKLFMQKPFTQTRILKTILFTWSKTQLLQVKSCRLPNFRLSIRGRLLHQTRMPIFLLWSRNWMRKLFLRKPFTPTRILKTTLFTWSKTLLLQVKRCWLTNFRLIIQWRFLHQTRLRPTRVRKSPSKRMPRRHHRILRRFCPQRDWRPEQRLRKQV